MASQKIDQLTANVEKLNSQLLALNQTLNTTLLMLSKAANTPGIIDPKTPQLISQANEVIKQEVKVKNDAIRATAKYEEAQKNAAGSIRQLKAEMNDYKKKLDDVADVTGKGRKEAEEYRKHIERLSQSIKENTDVVERQRMNIRNFKDTLEGVWNNLLGAAAGMATFGAAMSIAKEIIASTDALADKFQMELTGITEGLKAGARAIANWDMSGFIEQTTRAYEIGKKYFQMMDSLEDSSRSLEVAESKLNLEIAKQERIFKDKSLSIQERKDAEEQMKQLSEQLLLERKRIAQGRLDAEVMKASQNELAINSKMLVALVSDYDGTIKKMKEFGYTTEQIARVEERWNSKTTKETRDAIATQIIAVNNADTEYQNFRTSLLRTDNAMDKQTATIDKQTAALEKKNEVMSVEMKTQAEYTVMLQNQADARAKAAKEQAAINDPAFDSSTLPFNQKGAMDQALQEYDDFEKEKTKIAKEEEDKRQKIQQAAYQAAQAAIATLASLNEAEFNRKQGSLNKEVADLENAYSRKQITEKQYNDQKAQLDAKQRKLTHDKAEKDKQLAIFQATINTAMSVANALKDYAFPYNLIVAAIMAGLGAAQISAISSQPVPAYEKGRKGGKAEWAVVHPGELIATDKGMSSTPDKPALTFLPAGADVITKRDADLMKKVAFSGLDVQDGHTGYNVDKMLAEAYKRGTEDIVEAIKSKDMNTHISEGDIYSASSKGINWSLYELGMKQ